MFGSTAYVRGSVRLLAGHLLEPFNQGDWGEGLGAVMAQIPGARHGVCKSLCMNWVAHHANDNPERFSDFARSMGSGRSRSGGRFEGVGIALNQLAYGDALAALPANATGNDIKLAKDRFTDDFLRQWGVVQQMKMHDSTQHLSMSMNRGPFRANLRVKSWFGRQLGGAVVGDHTKDRWSDKIISVHGPAGGHAIAAFVGADAVFFDPNYGIFYFKHAADFRRWLGDPGGFYWVSNYVNQLGDDFVIRSYAKAI